MIRRFQQMQPEERVTLAALWQQGHSLSRIARVLARSASSLSREVARNSTDGDYASRVAQRHSEARRTAARPARKLDPDGPL